MGAMAGVLDSTFREAGGGSDQDDGDVSVEGDDVISDIQGLLCARHCSRRFAHINALIPHNYWIR